MASHENGLRTLLERNFQVLPHSIACSGHGQSWSCHDLDRASLALVTLFDARGLVAGEEVPIFLSRCLESVASVVALVRLGICFVPMDVESWSQGRVDAVLAAVQPKHVIFSAATKLACGQVPSITAEDVSTHCHTLTPDLDPALKLDLASRPDDADRPVYILFTSGSTGQPKGVVIPRRCVDHYVQQGRQGGMPFSLDVQRGDKVLLLFSLAFDAAWGVFFSTLCWGGELVLSQPGSVLEDARQCTILPATPSLLLSLGDPAPYEHVRSIFLGGEAPNPAQIQQWSAPHRRLFNCYGPTEATICASMAELRPGSPIVLGYPIPGTQLVLLDGAMQPADQGELCIAGPGVAAGYYQNAALTGERFLSWQGLRLYRTGDRARRTPDGLVFEGREDSMVKNRGFLINLDADVVPALLSYPGVVSAAAFMHRSRLVAVVAPYVDSVDMRRVLAARYDAFVVPDCIESRDALPRTSNGKVDVRLLQASFSKHTAAADTADSKPGGPEQRVLCEAVAEALGWPPGLVPLDRSFWDMGGNSLLAVRLLSSLLRQGHSLRFEDILAPEPLSVVAGKLQRLSLRKSETAPMTPTQLGMVHSSLRQPGVSYMLISFCMPWETQGDFGSRLRAAWQTVLQRHSVFRTSFDLLGGLQTVHEAGDVDWAVQTVDRASHDNKKERAALWTSIQHGPENDVFVPVNAFRLLVDGSDEARLLWLVHHSLIDGWSVGILVQEVQAVLRGETLPPQKLQFADFSQHLPAFFDAARDTDRPFWDGLVADFSGTAPLALPRPADGLSGFGQVHLTMAPALSVLQQRCRTAQTTLAAVFHTAWALLLRSYTGQSRVLFGTVFSGRDFPLAHLDEVVGPVINTCPFPVCLEEASSTADGLAHVLARLRLLSAHQWSASEAVRLTRALQTMLFLEYDLPGLGHGTWRFDRQDRPEFGLTVSVRREQAALRLQIVFDRATYTAPVVSRMLSHLRNLVLALLDPRCESLSDVRDRMLDPDEWLALTAVSTALTDPYVGPPDLKTAFETGVDQWPDAVALEGPSASSMTYRSLDRVANHVARSIAAHVHHGEAVGVLSDRSLPWIVAVLAVVKAGAVYVPLDTQLPRERLESMLAMADVKLCLFPTDAAVAQHGGIFTPSLALPALLGSEAERLPTATQPGDAAYITFTSGSTGAPKGVQIVHEAVVSYLSYGPARLDARPGRRHAQMFAPGFDVSQAEIFGTLCYGATLVLPDPDSPFAHLARVDATMITPSFLSVCQPERLAHLDTILFAGEAVPQALADRWAGGRRLYNSYGPCECTIGCLVQPLTPHEPVTLGRPMPRVGVYLLDDTGRPVPCGVPGEICLSGLQVADGYMGAALASLSRARFAPDPFVPGLRMYRTGDCAAWTERLEPRFIGRFDSQVKVRGYRVELAEVENVITLAVAAVRRAAAVVQGDVIVAFVEPATVDIAAIDAALRQKLPAYACPSRIVALPSLPTMPNQKLDRKALQTLFPPAAAHSPTPLTALQQTVAGLWKTAVGLPPDLALAADADFLALGGSSLSQIRVAQMASRRLGRKLPLKLFVTNTTLSALSAQIAQHCAERPSASSSFQQSWLALQPPFAAVTPAEQELVLLSLASPTPQAFHVTAGVRLAGAIDALALQQAIQAVATRESILQSCFLVDNGTVSRRPSASAVEIEVCHDARPGLTEFASRPFDLLRGPLTRFLLSFADKETTILLVQHHAITDKAAMKELFRRIQAVYRQQDPPADGPQYPAWATWMSSTPHVVPEATVQFWRTQLLGLPGPVFPPAVGAVGGYVGKSCSVALPLHPAGMELVVALVAAALSRVQGCHDAVIGIPYMDRTEPGTEDMLGFFLDRIPIRVQSDGQLDADHVRAVGVQIQEALAHAVCLEDIRRITGRGELFQVMVVYNRQEDALSQCISLPGVTADDVFVRTTGAKFPLLVEFTEHNGATQCDLEFMEHVVPEATAVAIGDALVDIASGWALGS